MSYEVLGHTADVRLQIRAGSREELFRDALLGMMHILKKDSAKERPRLERNIFITAPDIDALIIDFLNEALALSDTNNEIYTDADIRELANTEIRAILFAVKVSSFDCSIKAVAYHEARIKLDKDGFYTVTIIFDV